MMITLMWRTVQRVRLLFTVLSLILVSFQMAIVAYATSLEGTRGFDRIGEMIPSFLQETFGPALMSFQGMAVLGFFEPLIVMLVVQFSVHMATEPAGDVETGLVDLVLARAVPRDRLITRSLVMMIASSMLLPLIMAASLWLSLWWLTEPGARWPETRVVTLLIVHLAAVSWCFGGAALAAAAWARRRGSAQMLVGVAAVGLYLVDVIAQAWSRVAWAGWLSPFNYFRGAGLLAGRTMPSRDLSILFVVGLAGVIAAYWKFSRRDV